MRTCVSATSRRVHVGIAIVWYILNVRFGAVCMGTCALPVVVRASWRPLGTPATWRSPAQRSNVPDQRAHRLAMKRSHAATASFPAARRTSLSERRTGARGRMTSRSAGEYATGKICRLACASRFSCSHATERRQQVERPVRRRQHQRNAPPVTYESSRAQPWPAAAEPCRHCTTFRTRRWSFGSRVDDRDALDGQRTAPCNGILRATSGVAGRVQYRPNVYDGPTIIHPKPLDTSAPSARCVLRCCGALMVRRLTAVVDKLMLPNIVV
jgi:hypothetical protein